MKQSFYLARSSESGELPQRSSFAHEGPSPSITERMEVWRQTQGPIPALHMMSPSPGSAFHLRNDGPALRGCWIEDSWRITGMKKWKP